MNYIPLRVKTNYSLLTSLNTIESLAKRAKELNINALSITDDNMFGVMEFYKTMLRERKERILDFSYQKLRKRERSKNQEC